MKVVTQLIGLLCFTAAGYLAQAAHSDWKVSEIYWSTPEVSAALLSGTQLDKNYSYNTSREVLTRCVTTISSKHFARLVDAEKSAITLKCRELPLGLVAKNAPHAEAHLLLALIGENMQDADAVRGNLAASQVLAPRDRFNVEWRLILASRAVQQISALETDYDCRADVTVLTQNLKNNETIKFLKTHHADFIDKCSA